MDEERNPGSGTFTESETSVSYLSGGHRYRIKTFSAAKKAPTKSMHSCNFKIGEHEWQVVCYPGGETEEVKQFVSLFLGYRGPDPSCCATWMLRCVNQDNPSESREREWAKGDKYNTFHSGRRWGWQKFLKRDTVLDPSKGFLKDDTIIFEATVDIHVKTSTTSKPWTGPLNSSPQKLDLYPMPPPNLSNDFKRMFESGAFSDVLFTLDDGAVTLTAHSQILAARSPVFAKTFEHYRNLADNNDNEKPKDEDDNIPYKITITDVDSRVFSELLRFVYCGDVSFLKAVALKEESDDTLPDDYLSSPGPSTTKRRCKSTGGVIRVKKRRKLATPNQYFRSQTGAGASDESGGGVDGSDSDSQLNGGSVDDDEGVNRNFIMALLEAADKYELNRLRLLCEHNLSNQLDADTVCDTLVLADKHSATKLKKRCMDFISNNPANVITSAGFKNLSQALYAELFSDLATKKTAENTMLTVAQRTSGVKEEEPEDELNDTEIFHMNRASLLRACSERGLSTNGSRVELIQRLRLFLRSR